jgi:hypothetical protein
MAFSLILKYFSAVELSDLCQTQKNTLKDLLYQRTSLMEEAVLSNKENRDNVDLLVISPTKQYSLN